MTVDFNKHHKPPNVKQILPRAYKGRTTLGMKIELKYMYLGSRRRRVYSFTFRLLQSREKRSPGMCDRVS